MSRNCCGFGANMPRFAEANSGISLRMRTRMFFLRESEEERVVVAFNNSDRA